MRSLFAPLTVLTAVVASGAPTCELGDAPSLPPQPVTSMGRKAAPGAAAHSLPGRLGLWLTSLLGSLLPASRVQVPSPPPEVSAPSPLVPDVAWTRTPRDQLQSPPVEQEEPAPSVRAFAHATSAFPPRRVALPATTVAEPERQARVRRALSHAWSGYRRHAWGLDELEPLRQAGVTSFRMGLTLVDSLDSLIVAGLETEVQEALEWIDAHLHFGDQEEINLFEVTIRVLGGLLSAYEATGHDPLLRKAEELGRRLLFAFHTPYGLPYGTLGLRSGARYNPKWSRGACTIAEVTTLQLEFRALSRHTREPAYEAVAQRVMDHLRAMADASAASSHATAGASGGRSRGAAGGRGGLAVPVWPADLPRGLYPMFISPETGEFTSSEVTLGARADSLYEYLLKQWLLSGQTDARMRRMYDDSVGAIRAHLVRRGGGARCGNCTYLASWNHRTRQHSDRMDHLACFAPGMLALGAAGPTADADMQLARELMGTCYRMYADSPTGLAAEIAEFSHPTRVSAAAGATHCLLRPETVESLFILWRLTGDSQYREWGWRIFEAVEREARVPSGGYAPLSDVRRSGSRQLNGRMESFFTAETLKYLYLLFGDGADYPLDQYVFNTEAHPLRIRPEYARSSASAPPQALPPESRPHHTRAQRAQPLGKASLLCRLLQLHCPAAQLPSCSRGCCNSTAQLLTRLLQLHSPAARSPAPLSSCSFACSMPAQSEPRSPRPAAWQVRVWSRVGIAAERRRDRGTDRRRTRALGQRH